MSGHKLVNGQWSRGRYFCIVHTWRRVIPVVCFATPTTQSSARVFAPLLTDGPYSTYNTVTSAMHAILSNLLFYLKPSMGYCCIATYIGHHNPLNFMHERTRGNHRRPATVHRLRSRSCEGRGARRHNQYTDDVLYSCVNGYLDVDISIAAHFFIMSHLLF